MSTVPDQTMLESLVGSCVSKAWGQVVPRDWLTVSATSTFKPGTGAVEITLHVIVLPHAIVCTSFGDRIMSRPGGGVHSTTSIPMKEFADAADAAVPVVRHMDKVVRYAAGLLREFDPRIGMLPSSNTPTSAFPRSPLFDPPRIRPPAWKGNTGLDAVSCPFCNDGFSQGYPAMWAGGNLMWTHPTCWLRVHDGRF